jgi:hypothetical protein
MNKNDNTIKKIVFNKNPSISSNENSDNNKTIVFAKNNNQTIYFVPFNPSYNTTNYFLQYIDIKSIKFTYTLSTGNPLTGDLHVLNIETFLVL